MMLYPYKMLTVVLAVAMISIYVCDSASALQWHPAKNTVLIESSSLTFTIGSEVFECEATAGEGTISSEGSKWTFTPKFSACGAQVKAGAAWTAEAVGVGEATLAIPKEGEKGRVTIEISPKCKVLIEEGGTLGSAGDFINGANGAVEPSTLAITEQKVPVVDSPAACLHSPTSASINARFLLIDLTNESNAIGITNASAGPFWHHRSGGKGEGEKIESKSPESVSGTGGEQILTGEVAGTKVEIATKSVKVTGIIYNNTLQGQAKIVQKYEEPKLVKPALKECIVKIGASNETKSEAHLATPGMIFTPLPIESGAKELPKGTFTEIALTGSGCGVLAGKFAVKGNA